MPRLLLSLFVMFALSLTMPVALAANIQYKTLPLAELKRLATQGDPEAQRHLGIRYDFSQGMPRNVKETVVWYRKAAEQGDADAQYNLGVMYRDGKGVPRNDKEAVAWFRKAAEQGDAAAQNNLAVMYANVRGVPQDDKEAVVWYRKAADQGDVDAQYNLGVMYANGRGVPQADKEAVTWYRKAAEQGHAKAQFNLGNRYLNGEVVLQDHKEAAALFRKAAEQGHAGAQNTLGLLYGGGRGVPRDAVLAYMLFNLSAAGGNDMAPGYRTYMAKEMSAHQIEEGQVLSSKWKVGTPLPTASKTGHEVEKKPVAAAAEKLAADPPKKTGNCRPTGSSIRCQSHCINGDCIVTYENGCEIRVQVQSKFNSLNNRWEYPSPGC